MFSRVAWTHRIQHRLGWAALLQPLFDLFSRVHIPETHEAHVVALDVAGAHKLYCAINPSSRGFKTASMPNHKLSPDVSIQYNL